MFDLLYVINCSLKILTFNQHLITYTIQYHDILTVLAFSIRNYILSSVSL